jgi:hypothetical protein
MSALHLHLAIVHAPLFGLAIGLLVAVVGAFRRSGDLRRMAYAIFGLSAILAGVAYLAGKAAKDLAEKASWATGSPLEAHEAAGTAALVLTLLVGLVAMVAFARDRVGKRAGCNREHQYPRKGFQSWASSWLALGIP